jgi:hypothetical protein
MPFTRHIEALAGCVHISFEQHSAMLGNSYAAVCHLVYLIVGLPRSSGGVASEPEALVAAAPADPNPIANRLLACRGGRLEEADPCTVNILQDCLLQHPEFVFVFDTRQESASGGLGALFLALCEPVHRA